MVKHLLLIAAVGCGEVTSSTPPDSPAAASDAPGMAIDAAVDASPDADRCPAFALPTGAVGLHSALCTSALGFNAAATPQSANLPCPDTGAPTPGTYGKILRPTAVDQVDGCAATQPVTRILSPPVSGAVTETSTAQSLTVAAGSRFRVRVGCPGTGCSATIQVTGRAVTAGSLIAIQGSRTIANEVVDVDVAMPAALVGTTTNVNLIVIAGSTGAADVLWENPSIGP